MENIEKTIADIVMQVIEGINAEEAKSSCASVFPSGTVLHTTCGSPISFNLKVSMVQE